MAQSHDQHHRHHHSNNILVKIAMVLHLPGFTHDHSHGDLAGERAFLDNQLAIRTVWIALIALGLTTALQVVIFTASGSVALLADTVHSLGDALNSVPLLIVFYFARRTANRRFTYGYGRLAASCQKTAFAESNRHNGANYPLARQSQSLGHLPANTCPHFDSALARTVQLLAHKAKSLPGNGVGTKARMTGNNVL